MTKRELKPDCECGYFPIYFRGSNRTHWRNVYKKGDALYVQWCFEMIEVANRFGFENISDGWYTVDLY